MIKKNINNLKSERKLFKREGEEVNVNEEVTLDEIKEEVISIDEDLKENTKKIEELEKKVEELMNEVSGEEGEEGEEEKEVNVNEENKRKNNNVRKMEKFSLLKTIKNQVEGRGFDDTSLEVIESAKLQFRNSGVNYSGSIVLPFEYRAINASTSTEGKEIVGLDTYDILAPLRDKSVVFKAGATYLKGLVGDVKIPVYDGTNATWEGEASPAQNGAGSFDDVTLKPKRITTYVDVTKQWLIQDSVNAEKMLMDDISNAIWNKLETSIFDDLSGTTRPDGLFYGASVLTGSTNWDNVVKLETIVNEANALQGSTAYVVSPSLYGKLKTTKKDAGSGIFLTEGSLLNGQPLHFTNNVKGGKVVFGNFNELLIGNWGAIDITVDPLTQAINGKIRLVINTYFDFKMRREASFAFGNFS